MLSISDPAAMREHARDVRRGGRRLGFVPTMGALHAGHLALVADARTRADAVVLSVFVNPLQFGPGEDFARYPRDLPRDSGLAERAGVDVLWAPAPDAMYPEPPRVTVQPGPAGERLEGAVRPGHFAGVLTVVAKLLHAVEPDVAIFGRKDFQQAALIRRMVRDLGFPVEIVVAPTVREPDGLAMSSRNAYLDAGARAAAAALSRALATAVEAFRAGERGGTALSGRARRVLEAAPGVAIDYVACVAPDTVEPVEAVNGTSVLALAARVGGTRLIDNVVLGAGLEEDVRVGG
ncbi:MAG TPA: pantoate--beta-alanine ligase [Gemmatimonadales bacterium]|nr:pantoate--beta-alanine ligase [Gemmatimonadales bacterium]